MLHLEMPDRAVIESEAAEMADAHADLATAGYQHQCISARHRDRVSGQGRGHRE